MPLTFPAHQAPLLPLKIARPAWFDGTALVVAAGAPDLNHAFGPSDPIASHDWDGLFLWAIPFAMVYATMFRRWAADGLFAATGDLGPLRLRSYRVLGARRPNPLVTFGSAFLGGGSHILLDSFTHSDRWGSELAGLSDPDFTVLGRSVSIADALGLVGSSVGSVLGALLFVLIASEGHLERWYGESTVRNARRRWHREGAGWRLLLCLGIGGIVTLAWSTTGTRSQAIFIAGFVFVLSLLVAGMWIQSAAPPDERD